MASVNRAIIAGNVGQDPEIKTFENGGQVANFSVATSESYKKDDEWVEKTQWHNIVVKDKFIIKKIERSVQKGTLVHMEGKIETRTYEKDNEKRYVTEVVLAPYDGKLEVMTRWKGSDDSGYEQPQADPQLDEEIPY